MKYLNIYYSKSKDFEFDGILCFFLPSHLIDPFIIFGDFRDGSNHLLNSYLLNTYFVQALQGMLEAIALKELNA